MITLESLDNPYVVPFMMNCQEESATIISKAVPIGIQDNATFVLSLDTLEHRKDLFSDENGSWVMTGCKGAKWLNLKSSTVKKVQTLQ